VNAPKLLDAGTFRSWDDEPADVAAEPSYAAGLARARAATGLDESVITGEGRLGGHRVAAAACEFGFLGGVDFRPAGRCLHDHLSGHLANPGKLPQRPGPHPAGSCRTFKICL
jgi:hypothetical protein